LISLAVSSYGTGARESKGQVQIVMDLTTTITNKHVLIVEDIIDSGHTLSFVMSMLQARQPASIKLCTLLDKPSRREVDITVDYVGFEIPNKFVFGYGLDLDEKFRNSVFHRGGETKVRSMQSDLTPRLPIGRLAWSDDVYTLQECLEEFPHPVYVVGGAVRDALMRRPMSKILTWQRPLTP
jgi:hypothetical protein